MCSERRAWPILILLGAVYLALLAIDLWIPALWHVSTALKYAGLLLCLLLAVLTHRRSWRKSDADLLVLALGLTAVADLFLLLLNRPIPGIVVFCLVHLVYLWRYQPSLFRVAAAAVPVAFAGIFTVGPWVPGFPVQAALAALYGVLILTVTACGARAALPPMNRRLVTIGMVLFVLCDVHVALFNALPTGHPYLPAAGVLMWFFYLPAQALLALSAYDFSRKHRT